MYVTKTGRLIEAANTIIHAELDLLRDPDQKFTVWLDTNSGDVRCSSNPLFDASNHEGAIVLWKTQAGLHSLSELRATIERSEAEPFHRLNFFEWYLKFHFVGKIDWR